MYYTRDEIILQLKKEINKSLFVYKKRKFIKFKKRSLFNAIKLNVKLQRHQYYWSEHLKNRKNYLEFNRTYLRSKNRQIYSILKKYKHYILTFKSFFSNFYIMLTDNKGNPILSCSTGQVSHSRSKKRKNSMMLIYPMMQKVKSKLLKHGIKHIAIHIRTDINSKIVTAIRFLGYSKLKFNVSYIALLKPVAHHFGRRKKKPRRI